MTLRLESGEARVSIDPVAGGRIASLEIAGLELLVQRDANPMAWGSYPMAPWAGRIRRGLFEHAGRQHRLPINMSPDAIHGTTFEREWREEGEGRLAIDLGPDWPFAGSAHQEFHLEPGRLRMRLEVRAENQAFPASLGWHPWFQRRLARGAELELEFSARSMYRHDDDGVPDGVLVAPPPRPWDNCFRDLEHWPRLTWPGAIRLELTSTSEHWVVYDEPAHAICVEPTTGPPDALNLAPELVTPERSLYIVAEVRWELL